MKKILFTTTAGSGHFQVLSSLAQALLKMGNEVKVAAPESFRPNVEATGLEFAPFDDSDKHHTAMAELHAGFASGDPAEIEYLVGKILFGLTNTQSALPRLEETIKMWSPDLIISESAEVSGGILAAKYGIRLVRAAPISAVADQQFMPSVMDGIADLLKAHGLERAKFEEWLMQQKMLSYFPEAFGSPKLTLTKEILRMRHEGSVINQKKSKPPLIYVTMGSESSKIGFYPRVIQSILDNLTEVEADIIVAVGKDVDISALKCNKSNVKIKNWVNQREILSRTSLIICHGGSGTILDALAAGIPIIVVPLFADQPLNAAAVESTNCGYGISENNIATELASKVELALKELKTNSQSMRQAMALHPSVAEVAKSLINTLYSTNP